MSKTARHDQARQEPKTHKEDPILSAPDVARMIGKHQNTVRSWINDGLLEAIPFPGHKGRYGVRRSVVMRLLSNSSLADRITEDVNS